MIVVEPVEIVVSDSRPAKRQRKPAIPRDCLIEQTNRARTAGLAVDLFLLLALSTLWGASYTFIRIGVETIPPLTLIA